MVPIWCQSLVYILLIMIPIEKQWSYYEKCKFLQKSHLSNWILPRFQTGFAHYEQWCVPVRIVCALNNHKNGLMLRDLELIFRILNRGRSLLILFEYPARNHPFSKWFALLIRCSICQMGITENQMVIFIFLETSNLISSTLYLCLDAVATSQRKTANQPTTL